MPTSPRHDAPILRKSPANSYCPWVDVGIDPYANLGKFQKFRIARKTGARMRIIPMCSINVTLNLSKQRIRRWRRPDAPVLPTSQKIGRPLVPSQQAPGLIGRSHAGGAQVVLTAGVKRETSIAITAFSQKDGKYKQNPHSHLPSCTDILPR